MAKLPESPEELREMVVMRERRRGERKVQEPERREKTFVRPSPDANIFFFDFFLRHG